MKVLLFLVSLLSLFSLSFAEEEYAKDVKERTLSLPYCDKPIGVITARSFKCKAAACQGDRIYFSDFKIEASPRALGDGLADMLMTALSQTRCFKVVERIALEEIKEELELMGTSPKQTLKAADFIITGAVTALELKASGIGGGGVVVPLPWIGGVGLKVGKDKAYIGLDMRIVRVKDAEILSAKAIEGKSERWNFGLGVAGLFGTTIGGAWFEAVKNTPLEEATRDLIAKAVTLIVNDLKSQSPNVLVGQRLTTYDEKGQVVKEEVILPKSEAVQAEEVKHTTAQAPQIGEIKREVFSPDHYKNTLWAEDFSACKLMPTTVSILGGQGECVEFKGSKWFATIKGEVMFEKTVQGFIPSKNWAIEYRIYFSEKGNLFDFLHIFIGKEGSPVNLHIRRLFGDSKFSGRAVPNEAGLPNYLNGQEIKIIIKKDGEVAHLFINGVRSLTVPVDAVALGTLPPKVVIKMKGVDIGRGKHTMITGLKLTQE
ncbi:MAG: CsgG/HfaB family protein [Aquificaceae bacterium]